MGWCVSKQDRVLVNGMGWGVSARDGALVNGMVC